ncbi:phage tail tape measure protein, partial [Streptomyces sp. BF23-18]|uniref:phage tail tape measure protein n=1 Tax=Streptomyces sp. BF23-18 TaxID=3240282 RepID=UPI0034E49599
MPRAASVWLDVLPSMAEFRRELRRELEEPVRQSATRAGEQGGEGLMSGLAGKMKAGALAAGAAGGVLVAKGVALSMEKAAASGKLQASLGLSDKDARKAGNAAGRLYANGVTETIEEGADSVKAIMSAGLVPTGATTKQLAEIATKTQDLSTLFEVDLGQAANAAGQAVKTGLAKNASEALDTMTRGFQVMGPRADDLADTFNEYSTIFRSLNLPIKTVTGLLAQGMAAGARDTDVVADALKEFQIRATDGSTASAAGFKSLGLSAKGMTSQIAKGGKGASDGLQTVLDKLRDMKDPVKRNAAAVALFGTKAEDMGAALYSLDPSKAEKDLGRVGGAAKKAGDDLRKNAGMQFEVFKRKALMAIGDAAARYAIPALLMLGHFLNDKVLPPVRTVASWLGDHLAPVLKGTGQAVSGTIRWFKEWGIWLAPLAVLIGGITLALTAQSIVTGTVIGVMTAYSLASRGIALVTEGWTAAQAALNAVMAINPFVLVAIAVVALGVALVIAWKKSQTFRDIVLGAWSAIQAGAMWLWTNGIKPMVDGFMTGVHALGTAASWLWNSVLKPTFGFIVTAGKVLAVVLALTVFLPITLSVLAMAKVFPWLWTNAIKPAFSAIVSGAAWLWSGVQAGFGYIMAGIHLLGAVFRWLYTNAVKPVVGWIVAGARLAWAGASLVFGLFTSGLHTLGGVFTWLWRKAVSPALSGVRSTLSTVYNAGIRPVFDALKTAVGKVG